jgi:hypothetical protein
MKKIVITRMYDFDYFHKFFFSYYLDQGYDDILIFSKKEHLQIITKSVKNKAIKLFELPEHQIPYQYDEEKKICNWIYQKALDYYEANYIDTDSVLLFSDDDEYYPNLNPKTIISRAIFFEWYLGKEQSHKTNALDFYNVVKSKQCKGQLLKIWNDPFYKESILRINLEKLSFLRECVYSSAFHRLIHKNRIINIPKNHFVIDHLKGIPIDLAKERIDKTMNLLKIEDDWCSNHYTLEFINIYKEYTKFYHGLRSFDDLIENLNNKLQEFESETSFYENRILPLDWLNSVSNVPSVFFKKKLT